MSEAIDNTDVMDEIEHVLSSPSGEDDTGALLEKLPPDWHVSWLGYDDGYLCQLQRHNIHELEPDDTITFISRTGRTANEALTAAIRQAINAERN